MEGVRGKLPSQNTQLPPQKEIKKKIGKGERERERETCQVGERGR